MTTTEITYKEKKALAIELLARFSHKTFGRNGRWNDQMKKQFIDGALWAFEFRTAIASVIGKERPKIDLNEVEKLVQYRVNANAVAVQKWYEKSQDDQNHYANVLRSRIGYTLEDLTPKTKEDDSKD